MLKTTYKKGTKNEWYITLLKINRYIFYVVENELSFTNILL